ncbi:hypothetical protein ANCCAN_00494 [Ancylostoma caninum]|uniref:Uncharacterized protein n=1 Tax=Ancylostoma caninum TaxID=29170 RepID=A0A368HCR3_ANCCA|nr:hypothetical protein ANCCAN_00494 [Ancylostoma caninum]
MISLDANVPLSTIRGKDTLSARLVTLPLFMQLPLLILACFWVIAGADEEPQEPPKPSALSIMLLRFENLQGVLANGKPCSLFSFIGIQCTMEMNVTVTIGDNELELVDLGQVTTASNKIDFTETTYGGWSNPMTIPLDGKPYQGFKLKVQITSHGLPVDNWSHEFADGSQLKGVSSYTSTRPGLLGTM